MDLIAVDPLLNLYDEHWPIRTYQPNLPPPKFVFAAAARRDRAGRAIDSIVCPGAIVSGGQVERCILGPLVRVNSYSHVEDSILFDGVDVGRHARDPPGDHRQGREGAAGHADRLRPRRPTARGLTVTENGIVVIAKGDGLEHMSELRSS